MESTSIALVWLLTIVSSIGCILFGLIMWNKGGNEE
ncbi:symporter small accessory protein [Pontibacillus salicampi]|uniref:Symporter small accessory protein n=1 Tax=Pontibacillus salicampi TaxID=1449801 RepID=A0ABV6LJX6_9BACI